MTRDYGQILLSDASSITVKSSGALYAWGFISGHGSVTVESGGSVYEWFQIADFRGGSASSGMASGPVFPFSQYYVQNIETPLTLHVGAVETVNSGVYASNKVFTTKIAFIGDSGMFKIKEGSLTKDYDENTDRLVFTINGEAELNALSLSLGGADINSGNFDLPMNNNVSINIESGKVAINQNTALLAGVEVNIADGADLTVSNGKKIYAYDYDEWTTDNYVVGGKKFTAVRFAPSKAYTRQLTDLKDARINVNGSLTAAGEIYTTYGGADICSSNGTGVFIQQGAPGTDATTEQVTQSNTNTTSHDIPITAAKLHNADNSYTETAKASAGATFTYCKCPDCGDGTWVKDVAAINDSTGKQQTTHNTLKGAVDNLKADQYIKLLHNTTEKTINVNNKSLYLDLNGRTVTGDISVTSGYKLYGMDNSSKEYIAPSGKIVGTVTGYATTYETPPVKVGDVDTYDRYVAIPGTEENGTLNLSFHHFNISVTGYRFELAAPECALFFIGKFQGDDAAKAYLSKLGFTLTDIDGTPLNKDDVSYEVANKDIPSEAEPGDSPVVLSGDAYLFEVYLMRSFKKDEPNGYTEMIGATAQATFKNNGTQDSKTQWLSFQDAWKNAEGLDETQQAILGKFLDDLGIPK